MAEPSFSPDGKWLWNGAEWIPAPPSEQGAKPIIDDEIGEIVSDDQVIINDIKDLIEEEDLQPPIISDSVVMGDIDSSVTIFHNSPKAIAGAVSEALIEIGITTGHEILVTPKFDKKKAGELIQSIADIEGGSHSLDAATNHSLGEAARLLGRYVESMNHFTEGVSQAVTKGDFKTDMRCRLGIARLNMSMGKPSDAERMNQAILKESIERKLISVELLACHYIAICRSEMGLEFESIARKSLLLAQSSETTTHCRALAFFTYFMHLMEEQRYSEARPYLQQALAMAESISDIELIILGTFYSLGMVIGFDEDPTNWLAMATAARDLAEESGYVVMSAVLTLTLTLVEGFVNENDPPLIIRDKVISGCHRLEEITRRCNDEEYRLVALFLEFLIEYGYGVETGQGWSGTRTFDLGVELCRVNELTGLRGNDEALIPMLTRVAYNELDIAYEPRLLNYAIDSPKREHPAIEACILFSQGIQARNIEGNLTGPEYDTEVMGRFIAAKSIVDSNGERAEAAEWISELVSEIEQENQQSSEGWFRRRSSSSEDETGRKGMGNIILGIIIFIVGIGLTVASQGMFLFWGAILFGAIQAIAGVIQLLGSGGN